jgi:hypothetical protein
MRLLRRLRYLLRHGRQARDLAEEIELHRAMAEEAQRAAGLSDSHARAAARRTMGNMTLAREDARQVWLAAWVESVWQDVRYAARSLANQPGFTAMALLALILGIGLNTSLFTAVNSVLSRPWDVPEPDRVVTVSVFDPKARAGRSSLTGARFLNQHGRTVEGVVAFRGYQLEIDRAPASSSSNVMFVTANFFEALRLPMRLGRAFRPEEDVTGAPPVAVISEYFWNERYGAAGDILGRTILLDRIPFTVIGVLAKPFAGIYENRTEVWAPFAALPLARPSDPMAATLLTDPNRCCVGMAARMRPGVTRERTRAELAVIASRYSAELKRDPVEVMLAGTPMLQNQPPGTPVMPVLAVVFTAFGSVLLGNYGQRRGAADRV